MFVYKKCHDVVESRRDAILTENFGMRGWRGLTRRIPKVKYARDSKSIPISESHYE